MQLLRASRQTQENQDQIILFCSPEFDKQANEMVQKHQKHFIKGNIEWKFFPDGFPNIFIQNISQMRGRDVVFMCSFLQHERLLSQLAVMFALPRYSCRSLTVLCPYFPTGTMERVDHEGQIATAQTFARILSSIPMTLSGPAKLLIFDIHALQERFYFKDTVLPLMATAVPLFTTQVLKNSRFSSEKFVVAFPDDGASKRFGKKFQDFPQVVCQKVRSGATGRIVTIKDGKDLCTKENHIVIVDDLVKTGGTLIECKNALIKEGALTVSCFVTHGVFPLESWKRFTGEAQDDPHPFTHFWITETCPEVAGILSDKKPFEVLSTADTFAESILNYH